jgi:hypothetical protein
MLAGTLLAMLETKTLTFAPAATMSSSYIASHAENLPITIAFYALRTSPTQLRLGAMPSG